MNLGFTLRDLYPNVGGLLSVREQTIPEAEEQARYGGVAEVGGRAITARDFWHVVAVLAVIVVVYYLVAAS